MASKKKTSSKSSSRKGGARHLPPRAVKYTTHEALRQAVYSEARRELAEITGHAWHVPPKNDVDAARRVVREACGELEPATEAVYVEELVANNREWQRLRENSEADEGRIRMAIDGLARALDDLDVLVSGLDRTGPFVGPLATWARAYAPRVVADLRAARVPWSDPPGEPKKEIAALVWRADVDQRDLLGLRCAPKDRELALMALLRGRYYPDLRKGPQNFTPKDVIKLATNAIRNARKALATERGDVADERDTGKRRPGIPAVR